MPELATTDPKMLETIFAQLVGAPDSQMSARLVEQTRKFYLADPPPSDQEQYDYLVIISRTSCCETSSFIKAVCGLDRYYERPGGPREEPWPGLTLHNTPLEGPDEHS